jgi:hypothetical protein
MASPVIPQTFSDILELLSVQRHATHADCSPILARTASMVDVHDGTCIHNMEEAQ